MTRSELNATVAQAIADQINNGSQTFEQYVDTLISQSATSSVPAVAVLSLFEGNVPSSERVDSLTAFAQTQFASYTALGVGNPALGPYEALGAGLASEAAFGTTYGPDAVESNADFVNLVYVQVFGVTPSAGAAANLNGQIDYFVSIYTAAGVDADTALLTARGAVFGQIIGYAFQDGAPNSALVSQVDNFFQLAATGDESVYEAPLPPASPNTGETFTLTDGQDLFTGTEANDTFQGLVQDLNTFDNLNGNGGADTLNLFVETSESDATVAVPTTATVKAIETINIFREVAYDGEGDAVVATKFQGATEFWQIDNAGDISGLIDGQTAGFRDVNNLDAKVSVASSATTATVALDGLTIDGEGSGVNLEFAGSKLATVSISGDIAFSGTAPTDAFGPDLNVALGGAGGTKGVQTLNLALTTNVDLSIDAEGAADLVTFDGSESTGGIRINLVEVPAGALSLETASTGSGADRVLFNNVASDVEEVSYDFGAGNDEIFLGLQASGETALSITLGAGEDVLTLVGGNIAVEDDELVGSVTITDFASAEDALLVENFDGFTAQNLVDSAIAGAETLLEAVTAVSELVGVGGTNITDFAQFVFDGNTYLYGDVGEGDGLAGDFLVGLTGVVTLNNTNVAEYLAGNPV